MAFLLLQSGMQEAAASQITLKDMKGPVLKSLVSHMYGTLDHIDDDQVLPLFLAADAHQLSQWILWLMHSNLVSPCAWW